MVQYTWLHKRYQLQCQETPIKAPRYRWHRGHLKDIDIKNYLYVTRVYKNVRIYDVVFSFSGVIPEFVSEIIAIVRQDTSHKLNKKRRICL